MLNLERNNIVQIKTLGEFNKDINDKKCDTNSYGDIFYKNSNLGFSDAMKRFCGMYFPVEKYISDNEIYLYAEDVDFEDITKYVFTADMINVYEGPKDEVDTTEENDDLSYQNYLDIIALINKEEYTLMNRLYNLKYSEFNDQYVKERVSYLDDLKNTICKKIMK